MEQFKVAFEGKPTIFHVKNRSDLIQSFHARGLFYESRQLLLHRDMIPMNSTIIDVGANVANHTLFYSKYTLAKWIYPFEPNPAAREILMLNIGANSDTRVSIDTSHVRYAVSGKSGFGQIFQPNDNNLGGARIQLAGERPDGAVECVRLDDLKLDGHIGFIKIDVEGMEIEVLTGGDQKISQFRPIMSIEISERNERAFWNWLGANKYQVITLFCEYLHVKTYIIAPAY